MVQPIARMRVVAPLAVVLVLILAASSGIPSRLPGRALSQLPRWGKQADEDMSDASLPTAAVSAQAAVELAVLWVKQTVAIVDAHANVKRRLQFLNKGWDARKELVGGRYRLGSLDLDLYDADLRHIHQALMSSERDHAVLGAPALAPLLETALSFLSVSGRYPSVHPRLSKSVWSSAPASWKEPKQFRHWRERNPDFDVRKLDDIAVAEWIREKFGDARIVSEFNELPRNILKSDTFRYLVVLMEGGVWADSDTAPVKPVANWGDGSTDVTDPQLLEEDARRATIWAGFDGSTSATFQKVSSSPPALVVSVEGFSLEEVSTNPHWVRFHWARRVQIVQWSFGGAKGHPVLLDAVGRIFARGRNMRDGTEATLGVLEWTGPGVFTDCVMRYLKARWGFDFDTLDKFDHPIRVGDVLILPRLSFHAGTSGETQDELDRNDPQAAVWHRFSASWKSSSDLPNKEEAAAG